MIESILGNPFHFVIPQVVGMFLGVYILSFKFEESLFKTAIRILASASMFALAAHGGFSWVVNQFTTQEVIVKSSAFGGIFLVISAVVFSRILRLNVGLQTAVASSIFVLSAGIYKIGCYQLGCCSGVLWGIPTQLVEMGFSFIVFGALMMLLLRRVEPWLVAYLAVFSFYTFRLGMVFARDVLTFTTNAMNMLMLGSYLIVCFGGLVGLLHWLGKGE